MLYSVLFLLFLAFLGSSIAIAYELFAVSVFWINLVLGGAAGALMALAVRFVWTRIAPMFLEEGSERRLINGFLVSLGGTAVGGILCFGLSLTFPEGTGVQIAQGILLIGCCLLGLRIGFMVDALPLPIPRKVTANPRAKNAAVPAKILDTSIIIDGRIAGLIATGFVEGEILVPEFILAELQNVADSSNSLRRRKGRRGLDVLNQLMQDDSVSIRVITRDYPNIREVDRKLIHLAKDENATLITTDYNLNRVAQVEGVTILNVNELSNAVKPRFIPGEGISVEIIDRGEEINQGIGYLDDGTMVVVENGRRHIGRTIKATVKSTLQTDAGRMLFVEPAGEHSRWER